LVGIPLLILKSLSSPVVCAAVRSRVFTEADPLKARDLVVPSPVRLDRKHGERRLTVGIGRPRLARLHMAHVCHPHGTISTLYVDMIRVTLDVVHTG
jgi:hypothetical protein